MKIKVTKISRHRNGVAGEPFNVVLFNWRDGRTTRKMVATLFGGLSAGTKTNGLCAVLDTNQTAIDNIEFANGNSWRGDDFEPELRAAITQAEQKKAA